MDRQFGPYPGHGRRITGRHHLFECFIFQFSDKNSFTLVKLNLIIPFHFSFEIFRFFTCSCPFKLDQEVHQLKGGAVKEVMQG